MNPKNRNTGFYQEYAEKQTKTPTQHGILPVQKPVPSTAPPVHPGRIRIAGYARWFLSGILRFFLFLFLSLLFSAALTLLLNEPLRSSLLELLQNL